MSEINAFMSEINWLVSLIVAVPLSIAGNLLTPLYLNWRARRSRAATKKRLRVLTLEYRRLQLFASDSARLNSYLLLALLGALLLFAIPGVFSGFASMFHVLQPEKSHVLASGAAFVAGFASAVLNLNAIMVILKAMHTYQRVRSFNRHRATIEAQISTLRSAT